MTNQVLIAHKILIFQKIVSRLHTAIDQFLLHLVCSSDIYLHWQISRKPNRMCNYKFSITNNSDNSNFFVYSLLVHWMRTNAYIESVYCNSFMRYEHWFLFTIFQLQSIVFYGFVILFVRFNIVTGPHCSNQYRLSSLIEDAACARIVMLCTWENNNSKILFALFNNKKKINRARQFCSKDLSSFTQFVFFFFFKFIQMKVIHLLVVRTTATNNIPFTILFFFCCFLFCSDFVVIFVLALRWKKSQNCKFNTLFRINFGQTKAFIIVRPRLNNKGLFWCMYETLCLRNCFSTSFYIIVYR